MKVTQISRPYQNSKMLIGKNKKFFRKLLNGGISSPLLYVIPINSDTTLSCEGFLIEHHKFVKSDIDGYHLIFRKKRLPYTSFRNKQKFTYYQVTTTQYGNLRLNRIPNINPDDINVKHLSYCL